MTVLATPDQVVLSRDQLGAIVVLVLVLIPVFAETIHVVADVVRFLVRKWNQ